MRAGLFPTADLTENCITHAPELAIIYYIATILKIIINFPCNILASEEGCAVTDPEECPDGTTLQSIGRTGNPTCVTGINL